MAKKSLHNEKEAGNLESVERDEVAQLIADTLNKAQKDGTTAAFFLEDKEDPSQISDWISTGSTLLDLAISNRKDGGLPVGRITELTGLEGTGKSLIAAHLIASTQRKGGAGVYIDTEAAAAPELWKALGVNMKNMVYLTASTVEDIFNKMEMVIGTVRKNYPDKLITIIVDSIAAASDSVEIESEHGKDGYNTTKAIVISKAMRKIINLIAQQRICVVFTNQLRMNMNAMAFGDKYVVPGGKALGYACSVRVRLNSVEKLKDPTSKQVIGVRCKAQVTKNRMGPPQKTAEFDILFDSGIQDLASWFDFLKGEEKGGYTLPNGEKVRADKFAEMINTDSKFKDEMYNAICDKYIMKYRDANSTIVESIDRSSDEDSELGKQKSEE